jgi:xanthine dehydrogenase molybdopterin-binding subunit B
LFADKKVYTSLKQIKDENIEDRIFDQPYKIVSEAAGTDQSHQFQGTFESGAQYHYFMEPFTCICIPTDQGLDVHCSTQWMDVTQIAISEALNISESA